MTHVSPIYTSGNNRAIVAKMGGLNCIVSVMESCAGSATVQIAAFHALRNIVCRNCELGKVLEIFRNLKF